MTLGRILTAAVALVALLSLPAAAWVSLNGGAPPDLRVEVVQSGLDFPWDLDFTPDGRMLVTERPGRIRLFASGEPGAAQLAAVEVPNVRAEGEAGLMGIAVDRAFPQQPWVYVCASVDPTGAGSDEDWHNVLFRYRLEDDALSLDGTLFDEPMVAAVHHNGCAVEMDAERHLWFTMGDGNVSAARVNPPQDPSSLNGKVLRINADGSIPDDNPVMPGADGPSAIWSMGHRNPQGLSIRASDGYVIEAEHGTDRDDEINHVERGGNYGYACFSGQDAAGPAMDGPAGERCQDASAYLPPLWASGFPTIATSGIRFLPDEGWGSWSGSVMVTTLKEQELRRFELSADGTRLEPREILFDNRFLRLRAAVIGPGGALYLSTSNGGDDVVVRVSPE